MVAHQILACMVSCVLPCLLALLHVSTVLLAHPVQAALTSGLRTDPQLAAAAERIVADATEVGKVAFCVHLAGTRLVTLLKTRLLLAGFEPLFSPPHPCKSHLPQALFEVELREEDAMACLRQAFPGIKA